MLLNPSARRAAVAAVLAKIAAGEPHLQRLAGSYGAVLSDDLCWISALSDALDVSDAALACAAAEATPDLSCVARIVYGARLTARAAGFAPPRAAPQEQPAPPAPQPQTGGAQKPIDCADLAAAFDALIAGGAAHARAPRRLLESMRRPEGAPTSGAVGRLLLAAYSDDREDLVQALCAAPYSVEPGNLRAALSFVSVQPARAALAAAVAHLRGAEAKDAALAAVLALDAARPDERAAGFSLAAAVGAVEQAVTEYARSAGVEAADPRFAELLRGAAGADRIWAATPEPLPPVVRVTSLLESLTHVRVARDLELVPDGCSEQPCAGAIWFDDAPGAPVSWRSLAAALEVPAQEIHAPLSAERVNVAVRASLASASASYLLKHAKASARRIWPPAEAAATFTAPAMTFSASRLNAYVKCPRRWFYDYMCEALDDPSSLHAFYGRVVHDALEALHRVVRMPDRHEASYILERLLHELDVAFGIARPDFASQLEYEVSRCRARRMAEQYVRWLKLEAARAPMEIIHVELLQRQRFGGHDFVGYIDRIDRPLAGGPVTIYDYKTGRIDGDPREYLEKVRRGDEAQLALYYAMRRASGDEIARIALVSIRDPRDDAWILALDIVDENGKAMVAREAHDGVLRASCSIADLNASLAALVARCDFLTTQGLAHFPIGDDPPCNFCAYARACRERPADGERIFAR